MTELAPGAQSACGGYFVPVQSSRINGSMLTASVTRELHLSLPRISSREWPCNRRSTTRVTKPWWSGESSGRCMHRPSGDLARV